MHDEKLQKAIDQFVLERINACGQMEDQTVADAYALFSEKVNELKQSLSSSQKTLFIDCENAFALLDGEIMQCYYRAGFSDAVDFLLEWRDKE